MARILENDIFGSESERSDLMAANKSQLYTSSCARAAAAAAVPIKQLPPDYIAVHTKIAQEIASLLSMHVYLRGVLPLL